MTTNYRDNAKCDAQETVRNFIDEIVEMLVDNEEASDDLLNDYLNGDSYHHENHTDQWYNISDAAAVLDQLSEYEETDTGLWDGCDMKKALSCCAAFTYANAVYDNWRDLIKDINFECSTTLHDYSEQADELQACIDSLETDADTADDENKTGKADRLRKRAAAMKEELEQLDKEKRSALTAEIETLISQPV
jgi:hypothetical protein